MLNEIMKEFREAAGPVELEQLSRKLGTDRGAMEGMLETLVRQGKLKEVTIGGEECTRCSGKSHCATLRSGLMGKVFELADKPA